MSSLYKTPSKFFMPLHHVRPRFKGDIEGVLLYIADSVTRIGECEEAVFKNRLNNCIREYPGNATKREKTISNWRTEITALFSFVRHAGDMVSPSRRGCELAGNRDLPEAFRKFLYTFQYPGRHLRPDCAAELIREGVKFKPVQTILRVLREGNGYRGNAFGLSRSEVCHCIFNDLRVTRDRESATATLRRILENRRNGCCYIEDGDAVRYAGDILDYMQIAGLLKTHNGKDFYLNPASNGIIAKYLASEEWFDGYDSFYGRNNVLSMDIEEKRQEWEVFADREFPSGSFVFDLSVLLRGKPDTIYSWEEVENLNGTLAEKDFNPHKLTSGDIGERGESLVYEHECMRLKSEGREDLIHLVKRIPTSLALGFDISSVESDSEKKRYIEVKSTTSFKPILFNTIHLTPNEWRVAETERERYFVYRLFICVSTGEVKLYMLQDPVGKYKSNEITMMPSSSGGVDVHFDCRKIGCFEEVLKWNS